MPYRFYDTLRVGIHKRTTWQTFPLNGNLIVLSANLFFVSFKIAASIKCQKLGLWTKHLGFRFYNMVSSSSYFSIADWIFLQTFPWVMCCTSCSLTFGDMHHSFISYLACYLHILTVRSLFQFFTVILHYPILKQKGLSTTKTAEASFG